MTDVANPCSAQIARGVQDVAEAAGYVLIICSADDPRGELKTVRTLRRKRVDGLILTPTQGERSAVSKVPDAHRSTGRSSHVADELSESPLRKASTCSTAADSLSAPARPGRR